MVTTCQTDADVGESDIERPEAVPDWADQCEEASDRGWRAGRVNLRRAPTDRDCPRVRILPGCPYQTCRMGYYLLEYALIDDYLARRTAFREAHLALAREAHRRGELILAGALAEPTDRAVLVWRADDRSVVERFIESDPYVHNGLVTSWTIRPWTVVVGDDAETKLMPGQ